MQNLSLLNLPKSRFKNSQIKQEIIFKLPLVVMSTFPGHLTCLKDLWQAFLKSIIQCNPLISTSTGSNFLCRYTEMSIYKNYGEVRYK